MAQQYWIGDFFIDLSRNQITQNGEPITLAPKALSVLTYLAKNRGKVVSQDELLSEVWQGTVVSPNTLQRSIAQLRKALGDDSKLQVYIKTHAKKGYSLECDVRWQPEPDASNVNEPAFAVTQNEDSQSELVQIKTTTAAKFATTIKPNFRFLGLTFVIVMFVFWLVRFFEFKPTTSIQVSEIRALTATDNKELAGIYSPDGKYIVFHRYSNEFCSNNIWAKNIVTHQEYQLTENLNSYGAHSFSKDGKSLVFVQSQTCTAPVEQKQCYYLMSLNFDDALQTPQVPTVLIECKNTEIRKPQWLDNDNIALLQKSSTRWKLINYSITEKQSKTLYQLDDGDIIDYDFSMQRDLFALFSTKTDGNYIEMLTSGGHLVSSHQLNYPKEISPFKFVYPNFSPFDDQLLFSTGRQLFTLSYDGQVANISFPLEEPISTPVFHPNDNRMLATKGQYDSDILSVPLDSLSVNSLATDTGRSIARSTGGEDNGIFQPNGTRIAFKTDRSGTRQIWLIDNNQPRQLSDFPLDSYVAEVHWAKNSNSMLVNVDKELTQLFLNGEKTEYDFEYPVSVLLDWDSEIQTALALVRIKGALTFVELSFTDGTTRPLNNKRVTWAQQTKDGRIVYTDHLSRFWLSGTVEDSMIDALTTQGSNKRFVVYNDGVEGDKIIGVNDDFQIWSYTIETEDFQLLGNAPNNIDYITDANDTDVLLTIRNISRKEVLELLLYE